MEKETSSRIWWSAGFLANTGTRGGPGAPKAQYWLQPGDISQGVRVVETRLTQARPVMPRELQPWLFHWILEVGLMYIPMYLTHASQT